jgi:dihydroneopterin aldolase/2-amino-4-hydroxy-6-hydroxymethyldihydropteridine diphosphokinase
VIKSIKKINQNEKFDLLETFSQSIAKSIMKMSNLVRTVSVMIEKPTPPIDEKLDSVGVEYTLEKNPETAELIEVYLSLGSNMGNRKTNLKKALKLLEKNPNIHIDIVSSLYETEPMYIKDQKSFYNIVAKAGINNLGPFELLGIIKGIEYNLGRKKSEDRYGPRPIDIDILYFGDKKIESEILEIPHPKISERKFVLMPLSEVAPSISINGINIKLYIKKTNLPERVKNILSFDL